MNCDTCTHRPDPVPFAVHESAMARMERTIRRLWILLIIDRIHSVRDRQIMVDRFVHGLTFEKIAELHDMSVRQIKNIVYRGQDKIFK